jgi:radical SAM/CxCxxxxC motif protein YfkAB
MLFGTLPFYPCSQNDEDTKLLNRIHASKNVTVRNDPDGRSRLNVNIFTGEVIVTDFGDTPAMGNIQNDSLPSMLDRWLERPLAKTIGCHCLAAKCLGPNLLVKDAYYPETDFTVQNQKLPFNLKSPIQWKIPTGSGFFMVSNLNTR